MPAGLESWPPHSAARAPLLQVSLFIELVRSHPALMFWIAVLGEAGLWILVPALFYGAPPGDLPLALAVGRHWAIGSPLGPPLAYWLLQLAFALSGHTAIGVYVLSQACMVVTFWAVFALGRSMVGAQHAVLAVLLTMAIAAFSVSTPAFGPRVLATALIALAFLHYWRAVGEQRPRFWLALAVDLGLLLLTTYAGLLLIGLFVALTTATPRGRAALLAFEPWLAGLLFTAIQFPHLLWLDRAGGAAGHGLGSLITPLLGSLSLTRSLRVSGTWLACHAGVLALLVLAGLIHRGSPTPAPAFARPQVDGFAKQFLYFLALAPAGLVSLLSVLRAPSLPFGGLEPLVILSGLAAIVALGDVIRVERQRAVMLAWLTLLVLPAAMIVFAVVVPPWTVGYSASVDRPATAMGQFFTQSFRRRTGQPLSVVVGASDLAPLLAMTSPDRPKLLLTDAPELSNVGDADLREQGGVIVWVAADISGAPPANLAAQFPDLIAEVPQAFERPVQGRAPLYRVGWAVIRPAERRR